MARSTASPVTPDGRQASVAAIEAAAAAAKPVFDWSELAAPVAMPNKPVTTPKKVDVLAEVPEPIRQRIEHSLMKTVARYAAKADSKAKRVRVDPYWSIQPVPDEERGAEFVKLATRYAKYRPADKEVPHADPESPKGQITVRCGAVTRYRQTDSGPVASPDAKPEESFLGVRFSARPFEGRKDTAKTPGA